MSRSPKSLILVVLMFAHAASDLQINFNISDSNSTTPILKDHDDEESRSSNVLNKETFNDPFGPDGHVKDPEINSSKKQKEIQSKLPDAQLSSCNSSTPPHNHLNLTECSNSSLNSTFDTDPSYYWTLDNHPFFSGSIITIFIPSFYTLVFIISVPLNICAVLVFVLRIKLKTPASIFMLNLACADLLFAAVLPFKIYYHFHGNNWIFGAAVCRWVSAAFFWNLYCSILLITCISVDRLLAIVYPILSVTWRNSRKAVIVSAVMWVLSFAGSMPLLLREQTIFLTFFNITTCYDFYYTELEYFYNVYYITLCSLLFFLPLVITAVSYTTVIVTLSKAQSGDARKKRRAVVLASTVLLMFVICFTPTNCFYIARVLDFECGNINSYIFYLMTLCLGSVNCILDPLVYYFGSSKFQKELSSMLGVTKDQTGNQQRFVIVWSKRSKTALKSNRKETNTPLTNRSSPQANLT